MHCLKSPDVRVGNADDLQLMKNHIEMIEDEAGTMLENHITVHQAKQVKIPEPFTSWWFGDFFYENLKFICKSLADISK